MKTTQRHLASQTVAIGLLLTVAAVSVHAQPYPSTVLGDNPIAYWRLSETSGTAAIDSSAAGTNTGSYTNVALGQTGYASGVASQYGYSPATDASASAGFGTVDGVSSNSYVSGMPLDFASSSNTAFSAEAWVNGASETSGAGIVGKGWGGGEEFFIDCGGTGTAFRFYIRTAAGPAINAASSFVPDGNWHHLVGVCDELHSSIYLYIDGALAASNTATGGILSTTNLYMTIGARQSGQNTAFNNQFSGTIGQVAIYRYALSAAQVLKHFLAVGIPPTIPQQPPNEVIVDENAPLVFPVAVNGTAPLTFDWTTNSVAYPGQTNATFDLSSTPLSLNGADLVLEASNAYGTAQTAGTVVYVNSGGPTFVTNLQPSQLSLYQGLTWTYSVTAQGTEPFYYLWYENGINIPGATNSEYTATAGAGSNSYYVVVSNNFGGGSSTPSSTVALLGVPVPTNSYPAAIFAAHPIAWWRLDESETGNGDNGTTANDYVGGHDGTYTDVLLGVAGYSSFDPDTACDFGTNAGYASGSSMDEVNNAGAGVPSIASYLQAQGSNVEFSVECWVKAPAGQASGGSRILSLGPNGSEAFFIDGSGNGGKFTYLAHYQSGSTGTIYSSIGPDGNWHQLVAVMDEATNGATVFYVDGNLAGTLGSINNAGIFLNNPTLLVGTDGTYQFNGTIDEVSFYNYPLSPVEITAHLNAAPRSPAFTSIPPTNISAYLGQTLTLSVSVQGSTPMTNQWYSNNIALSGQTNVALVLSNMPVGTNTFKFQVSNAYGSTNTSSVVAVAAGSGPPVLLTDIKPLSASIYATVPFGYSVAASGTQPLSYQWYMDNAAVAGATTSAFNIAGVASSNAGSYYCVVSNSIGTNTTSTAVLTVVAAPTNPYSLTVLKDHPSCYWRLDEANGSTIGYDHVGGNNGVYSNTAGITHSTGIFGTNFDGDTSASFNTNATYTKTISGISNYLGTTMTNVDYSVPNGQNGEFTVEAWAKGYPNLIQASGGGIVGKGYGNGGEEFNMDVHGGFRFYCRTANPSGGLAASAQAAPYLTGNTQPSTNWTMDGVWHHLVGVCDEANDNILLYVDGNLIGSPVITNGVVPAGVNTLQQNHPGSSGTNGALNATAGGGYGIYPATNYSTGNPAAWGYNSVSIGARNSGSGTTGLTLAFYGTVDELALYPYCFTPLQASNHYAVGIDEATTLSVRETNNQSVLSWYPMFGTGTLQSATSLAGPWTTIPGATSPYTVTNPGNSATFYRLKNF